MKFMSPGVAWRCNSSLGLYSFKASENAAIEMIHRGSVELLGYNHVSILEEGWETLAHTGGDGFVLTLAECRKLADMTFCMIATYLSTSFMTSSPSAVRLPAAYCFCNTFRVLS